jgi:hypothetical protein
MLDLGLGGIADEMIDRSRLRAEISELLGADRREELGEMMGALVLENPEDS